jgi:hypothetical protein
MTTTTVSREGLLQSLQYLDPNGCWTDELATAEGLDPCSLEEAQEAYQFFITA